MPFTLAVCNNVHGSAVWGELYNVLVPYFAYRLVVKVITIPGFIDDI